MDDTYYRAILDAIPLPVLVVDDDVRIQWSNRAATQGFDIGDLSDVKQRAGEALHCIHSKDSPEGCGRGPFCGSCVIRSSVREAIAGCAVARRRMKLERGLSGAGEALEVLVTASPLPGYKRLALLVIENITELTTLHSIIPICAKCKKIRDDQEYWQRVEAYFHAHLGIGFTHSLCPACSKELYPDVV